MASETRYLYDRNLIVQERNGANTVQVTYLRGNDLSGGPSSAGGIGGLLARAVWTGSAYTYSYYFSDRVGNVLYLDTGAATSAKYEYDPFGRVISSTSSSGTLNVDNKMRFSSKL